MSMSSNKSYLLDSEMVWSNGISVSDTKIPDIRGSIVGGSNWEERDGKQFNSHLTKLEKEIFYHIKFKNPEVLLDLGANRGVVDINFEMEVERGLFLKPLLFAALLGDIEILKILVENPTLDINCTETATGFNAFQIACIH